MDDVFLNDIKKLLEDGLDSTDWKCVEQAIEEIKESLGEYDDEFADDEN